MHYFHSTLLASGFTLVRPGFYQRPTGCAGGTIYCSVPTDDNAPPRKLLLWQAQRVLLQGDTVTLEAPEQVLRRVLPRKSNELFT